MKILIKKSFAGYSTGQIIEFDEYNKHFYTDVIYWLRRCEDGKIDGFCELIEWNGKKLKKEENMIQSKVKDDMEDPEKSKKTKVKRYTVTKE